MKSKGWFVILQQDEVERCNTPAQLLVFMSIKSYCANGKRQVGLSLRDICKRSKYSTGWTRKVINELKSMRLVFTHGTEGRRGGTVEVFSVGTVGNIQSVPPVTVSVPSVALSVHSRGTKYIQSNKVKKEVTKPNKTFSSYKETADTNELKEINAEDNQTTVKISKAGLFSAELVEKAWDWAEKISEKGFKKDV